MEGIRIKNKKGRKAGEEDKRESGKKKVKKKKKERKGKGKKKKK